MVEAMREKLLSVEQEYERLSGLMASQEVASDPAVYRRHATAHSEIAELVRHFRAHLRDEKQLAEADEILRTESDPEMRSLAEEEKQSLGEALERSEQSLRVLMIPKDPNDSKNTIMEIRAGTGGDEAGLFVADLFRAYNRFTELKGWKIEVLSSHETGLGGFKEIIFSVKGENVFGQLKFEAGVHRVQRVPATETQGRVHTSAVTVAVLPEAEEVEVDIDANDLQIDVYRSSGPGGQSVNTTDSAVRITHKPTGLVVTCQDEKSQHKNKAQAMAILRARLYQRVRQEEAAKRSADRRNQVGTGDRSERIRTYNFPQNRLSDHRINLTLYRLEEVMGGAFQPVVDSLIAADLAAHLSD